MWQLVAMGYLAWNTQACENWFVLKAIQKSKSSTALESGGKLLLHTLTPFIPLHCKCLLHQKPDLPSLPPSLACFEISVKNVWALGFKPENLPHFYQVVGMARLSLAAIDDIQFRAKLAIKLTVGKFSQAPAAIQTKPVTPLIEVLKWSWLLAKSMRIHKAQADEEKEGKERNKLVSDSVYCLYHVLLRKHIV